MKHGVHAVPAQERHDRTRVGDVRLEQGNASGNRVAVSIREVVDDDDVGTAPRQQLNHVGTDVPSSARHEDCHHVSTCTLHTAGVATPELVCT